MRSASIERVLVTGGAGFIGSHLVERLLEDGAAVTVLDNLSTGSERNLAAQISNPSLTFVRGTVLDQQIVDELVAESSLVFHLAAAVGVRYIVEDPLGSVLTNVRGTEHLLDSAHRHGRRIVLASTSEVYGRSEAVPFTEDSPRVLGPTWVHRWSYATAKSLDEHLAFAYADRGLPIAIVRYFNSYGPRIDERGYGSVIARFASQALAGESLTVHGDGQQSRSFTFISDTVDGTILAGRKPEAVGKVFNIGRAEETTILELAERVRSTLASRSDIVFVPYESYYPQGFQDTRRRVPDVSRAKSTLGFTAKVSLEEGLMSTLAWCRQNYAVSADRR
jgi:UDP-glucose 4-epimerase